MSGGMKGWQVKIIPNSGMPKAISTELSKPGKEHCGGKTPGMGWHTKIIDISVHSLYYSGD